MIRRHPVASMSSKVLLAVAFALPGCAAYSKAAYGVLDHMDTVQGSLQVVNTMSVPVCDITLTFDAEPNRTHNDLQGQDKRLPPGATGKVDIPGHGKASEQAAGTAPQPDTFTMMVYACKPASAPESERGLLLASIPVKKDGPQPVAIK